MDGDALAPCATRPSATMVYCRINRPLLFGENVLILSVGKWSKIYFNFTLNKSSMERVNLTMTKCFNYMCHINVVKWSKIYFNFILNKSSMERVNMITTECYNYMCHINVVKWSKIYFNFTLNKSSMERVDMTILCFGLAVQCPQNWQEMPFLPVSCFDKIILGSGILSHILVMNSGLACKSQIWSNSIYEMYLGSYSQGIRNIHGFVVYHDQVMIWKHFVRYWSFVRRIHWSPVDFFDKGPVMRSFDVSFVVEQYQLLKKKKK